MRPPPDPVGGAPAATGQAAAFAKSTPIATPGPAAVLDDAISRLVPALGPAGNALAAPLRQLRSSAGADVDPGLLNTIRLQLAGITAGLSADVAPDADALRLALESLVPTSTKTKK